MKTRSIIWVILGSLLFALPAANAQEKRLANRLKVSYGDAIYTTSAYTMLDALIGGHIFTDAESISSPGSFTLSYQHNTKSGRWSFGGDFGYTQLTETFKDGSKSTLSMYTVMASTECHYIKRGIFRMYGTLGVGGSFTDSGSGLAFQFNPVAFRIGSDRVAGFVEIGVGTKGVFNAGLEIGF